MPTLRCASLFGGPDRVRSAPRHMQEGRNSPRSRQGRQKLVALEVTAVMTRVTVVRLVGGSTFGAMRLGEEKGTPMLVED